VDPVPDPVLVRKSGSAGNRSRTSGYVARNYDDTGICIINKSNNSQTGCFTLLVNNPHIGSALSKFFLKKYFIVAIKFLMWSLNTFFLNRASVNICAFLN
jgi:hypothetical protein